MRNKVAIEWYVTLWDRNDLQFPYSVKQASIQNRCRALPFASMLNFSFFILSSSVYIRVEYFWKNNGEKIVYKKITAVLKPFYQTIKRFPMKATFVCLCTLCYFKPSVVRYNNPCTSLLHFEIKYFGLSDGGHSFYTTKATIHWHTCKCIYFPPAFVSRWHARFCMHKLYSVCAFFRSW